MMSYVYVHNKEYFGKRILLLKKRFGLDWSDKKQGGRAMILEDVGMVARSRGDPDAPPGFGARIMRITTDAGSFETPARILSASEHRARSEVSISKALPHDLAIDFRPLRTGDAAGLVNDSRVADRLIRTARQFEFVHATGHTAPDRVPAAGQRPKGHERRGQDPVC